METTITIVFPVAPALFAIFVGFLVVMVFYYAIKFVLSLVTGG